MVFSALSWSFGSSSWMCAAAAVPTCDWIWNSRRTAKKWWQSIDHCVAEKWGRRALKWMFNSGDKYWASSHIFFLGYSCSNVWIVSCFHLWVPTKHRTCLFFITYHMLYYNYWFTCLFLPLDWCQDHDIIVCVLVPIVRLHRRHNKKHLSFPFSKFCSNW